MDEAARLEKQWAKQIRELLDSGEIVAVDASKSGLEATKVTEKGISRIERYLNNTPGMSKWGANDEMIMRLKTGERTTYDLEFYQHELRESRNIKTMRNTFDDPKKALHEAHIKTSHQYGMDWWATHERLIHPDVLRKYE